MVLKQRQIQLHLTLLSFHQTETLSIQIQILKRPFDGDTFSSISSQMALFSSLHVRPEKHLNNLNCTKQTVVLARAENTLLFCSERSSH